MLGQLPQPIGESSLALRWLARELSPANGTIAAICVLREVNIGFKLDYAAMATAVIGLQHDRVLTKMSFSLN